MLPPSLTSLNFYCTLFSGLPVLSLVCTLLSFTPPRSIRPIPSPPHPVLHQGGHRFSDGLLKMRPLKECCQTLPQTFHLALWSSCPTSCARMPKRTYSNCFVWQGPPSQQRKIQNVTSAIRIAEQNNNPERHGQQECHSKGTIRP